MLRRDVQSGIIRSWTFVEAIEIGETISNPSPLEVNEEFRRLVLNHENSYKDVYMAGLRLSHYNFLLSDYSYFQFSWEAENKVRYAFYPNPFIAGGNEDALKKIHRWGELLRAEMITHEDYLALLRDAEADLRVPLIRYENAPDQHRGLSHPCSHFHIGFHSDNRWAFNRLLTPFAFSLYIIKQYYGSLWRDLGIDDADESGSKFERQLINEKTNCRPIHSDLFVEIESRSFYFS